MTSVSMDPAMLEWIYAREVMRRFGFPAEDLFFLIQEDNKSKKPSLFLVLKQGRITFNWNIGETDIPINLLQKTYETVCSDWNSGRLEYLLHGLQASKSYKQKIGLIAALQAKGIRLPNSTYIE